MPVSKRRVPKERPENKPDRWKLAMKRAMVKRGEAEREAIAKAKILYPGKRFEETQMLQILKDVPSIFAFAEMENVGYMRPQWASDRWGRL